MAPATGAPAFDGHGPPDTVGAAAQGGGTGGETLGDQVSMAATTTDKTDATAAAGLTGGARLPRWLALLLLSLAGLLLDVGYTRIVGYKLW